jgi:hypothetical protein
METDLNLPLIRGRDGSTRPSKRLHWIIKASKYIDHLEITSLPDDKCLFKAYMLDSFKDISYEVVFEHEAVCLAWIKARQTFKHLKLEKK